MRRTTLIITLFIFSVSLLLGKIPKTISYQGLLTDTNGNPITDGNYNLTFKFYEVEAEGASLWEETQEVTVSGGVFNVILGAVNPLTLSFDKPYWLGVTLSSGEEFSPRIRLTASAYSLNARSVADSAVTGEKIAHGQVVRSLNSLTEDVRLVGGDNVSVTSSGNQIVFSSATSGGDLTLPFNETVEASQKAFSIANTGVGGVASFMNANESTGATALNVSNVGIGVTAMFTKSNEQSTSPAVDVDMSGIGSGIRVLQSGSGSGAEIRIVNEENTNEALNVETNGPGTVASFFTSSLDSNSLVINASTNGAGTPLFAGILNGDNNNPAVLVRHVGQGTALLVDHRGGDGNIAEFHGPAGEQVNIDRHGNITTAGDITVGNKVIYPDGTEQRTAAMAAQPSWYLTGNANAYPDTAFLGTIDDQPFEIRVNNSRALRIEPVGQSEATTVNFIAGGANNSVADGVLGAAIAGGGAATDGNRVTGDHGAIGGGSSNEAGFRAVVGGGNSNLATAIYTTIGGGEQNQATFSHATVGGGQLNKATGRDATVAGGENNSAEAQGDVVSGGEDNVARSVETGNATVGGGKSNQALGDGSTISGGQQNTASGSTSAVGGGRKNVASGQHATVSGGNENQAVQSRTTVAGGEQNVASGIAATIGGGNDNKAIGIRSTVPGGSGNHARGHHSFAAGYQARAIHDGSFVWNDRSVTFGNDSLVTTADNQFLIRAAGGVGVNTDSPSSPLSVNGTVDASVFQVKKQLGQTNSPEEGGVYRDNLIYAWAKVNADGSVDASFGCDVSKNFTGTYTIQYKTSLAKGSAPVVTPFSANDPIIATVAGDLVSSCTVNLKAFVGNAFQAVDSPFLIQIVGRP